MLVFRRYNNYKILFGVLNVNVPSLVQNSNDHKIIRDILCEYHSGLIKRHNFDPGEG